MVWIPHRGQFLLIIPPGSKPFAGVDAPIEPQADYFKSAKRALNADGRRGAAVNNEIGDLGGMLWGWLEGYTSQSGIIADDVIADAGTTVAPDALTPENVALGSNDIGFYDLKTRDEAGAANGTVVVENTNLANPGELILWSFSKHPRFMDVVRWTGDGGASRMISHNLDRAPGMIMVKRLDGVGDWAVYHNHMTSTPEDVYMVLGTNAASVDDNTFWNDSAPTADEFFVGVSLNGNASEYIAFLFADDERANGIIRMGGYTGTGSGGVPFQHTGWRPDWILVKEVTSTGSWRVYDAQRNDQAATIWEEGCVIDNPSSPTVNTTYVSVNGAGWQTDSSGAGDEGMNDTGEDYIWVAIRVDESVVEA